MKKTLLFALALGLGSLTYGQGDLRQGVKVTEQSSEKQEQIAHEKAGVAGPINNRKSTKGNITSVPFAYSENVYGVLTSYQTCLAANNDLGIIQFTHRARIGDAGSTASGDIMHTWSSDGGDTWKTTLVLAEGTKTKNRYPSGVIYNPTGNTNPNNAFAVYCGPSHNGATPEAKWDNNYFGSMKLDATNINNQHINYNNHEIFVRAGLVSTTDGKVHVVGGITRTEGSSPNERSFFDSNLVATGTFNPTNNNFDWEFKSIETNFVADGDGSDFAIPGHTNTAWSNDGMTGYFWNLGRDSSNDLRTYMPIVWKTIDGGANWVKTPVFDFSTLTEITDYLQPMKGTNISRPLFNSSTDGVVDANGNLHLISLVKAAFSNHDDSLGYSYVIANDSYSNPVFDVYMTATGWEARHLGDVYTQYVSSGESQFGTGDQAIGWGLRLQAGKTADETKIFASWADTDLEYAIEGGNGFPINMFPDIYVVAWDINTKLQTNTTNFTAGTAAEADCYFHYMSDVILSDNGTYTVPITEIDRTNDPVNNITLNYLKGITFTDADFVTNPGFEGTIENIVSVSQNRPNPFSGSTSIDVNLDKSSELSIEIINLTGQKVHEMNYGVKASGVHTINLNGSTFARGIYFYTVKAGNSSVTKKMIVE